MKMDVFAMIVNDSNNARQYPEVVALHDQIYIYVQWTRYWMQQYTRLNCDCRLML